jgi:hypothetical protein
MRSRASAWRRGCRTKSRRCCFAVDPHYEPGSWPAPVRLNTALDGLAVPVEDRDWSFAHRPRFVRQPQAEAGARSRTSALLSWTNRGRDVGRRVHACFRRNEQEYADSPRRCCGSSRASAVGASAQTPPFMGTQHGVAVHVYPPWGRPIAPTAGNGRRSSTSTLSTENLPSRSRSASSFPRSRARSGAEWRASQKR